MVTTCPAVTFLFLYHLTLIAGLPQSEEVKKDWKKAAKGDAAVRLATLMNEEGKEGVAAALEQVRAAKLLMSLHA